jgi:HK97 family phage portal protein
LRLFERKQADPAPPNPLNVDSAPWGVGGIPWWIGMNPDMPLEQAVGLPALLGVLRLLSGAAMMMPYQVFDGPLGDRKLVPAAPTAQLLANPYGFPGSGAAFRGDAFMSMASSGEAFIRKLLVGKIGNGTGAKAAQLLVLDPRKVEPKTDGSGNLFYRDTSGSTPVDRTPDEILHVRLASLPGQLRGVAPITAARLTFETGQERIKFERSYYSNDVRPGMVFQFPEHVPPEEAQEWIDDWAERHQGAANRWRPDAIGGGVSLTTVPVSARDAQFVESIQLTAAEIGWIYQIPAAYSDMTGRKPITEQDRMALVTFALGPMMQALDEALTGDTAINPSGFTVAMDESFLLRPDYVNRMNAGKTAIQGAIKTPNEVRAEENLPPKPNGDDLQFPVVGGGPIEGHPTGEPTQDEAAAKALLELLVKALTQLNPTERRYSPDQDRDDHGRFAYEGGGESGGGAGGKRGKLEPFPETDTEQMTESQVMANNDIVNLVHYPSEVTTETAQMAKEATMRSLSGDLADNPDWHPVEVMQALDPDQNWWGETPVNGVVGGGYFSDDPGENATAYLVSSWANSASDHNMTSLLLQQAADQEFGDGEWEPNWLTEDEATHLASLSGNDDVMSSLRAFTGAEYDATQEWLKLEGVENVTAYRGMFFEGDSSPFDVGTFQEHITSNPLTSWSTDYDTAANFGSKDMGTVSGGYGTGTILATTIPASRILSVPRTGSGCLGEAEMVVVGSPDDTAWVNSFRVNGSYGSDDVQTVDEFREDVQGIQRGD